MRNPLTMLALAGLVGLAATPAMAQDGTFSMPTRVEVGANVTMLSDFGFMGGPQLAVNFAPRHAVQVTADLATNRGSSWWHADVIYAVQYRYTLPLSTAKTRVFLTAGGIGTLSWYHSDAGTYTTPAYTYTDWTGQKVTVPSASYSYPASTSFYGQAPLYPTGGIGIQHIVAKRIAVRGELSMIVAGVEDTWVGLRAAGGVVVPLGRAKK